MYYREVRDGFGFCAVINPFNKYNAIIIDESKEIEEYIKYINDKGIEQAYVEVVNLDFFKECADLKHLIITIPDEYEGKIDYKNLYELKNIKSLGLANYCHWDESIVSNCELERFQGLEELCIQANKGTESFNKITSLKSLKISKYIGKNKDLSDLSNLKQLDTLTLIQCKMNSLNGIENLNKMQCLYLYHNRSLKDISALAKISKTLKVLRIDCCPKIEDFSVLSELENVEMLELSGGNSIPNLDFIKGMKNLKTLIFTYNVLDGDLSNCMNLSYAACDKNRKHYNLKDKDLPKGEYVFGNEDIELWRRLR